MIDKPNCSNCPNNEEQDNVEMGEWVTVHVCMGKVITWSSQEHTRIYGCLSHPGAREWIMRDVIGKLHNLDWDHMGGSMISCREAIALIGGKS